jgi:hypothetical protein
MIDSERFHLNRGFENSRIHIKIYPDNELEYGFSIRHVDIESVCCQRNNAVCTDCQINQKFVINTVCEQSAASIAGLGAGDLVLTINGTDVSNLMLEEAESMIKYSKYSSSGQLDLLVGKKSFRSSLCLANKKSIFFSEQKEFQKSDEEVANQAPVQQFSEQPQILMVNLDFLNGSLFEGAFMKNMFK